MTMVRLSKEHLGLAAEFAVASELCRRNLYAQLTLGTRKRTDLLVETDTTMLRIQVKAKQGKEWPNCTGVFGQNIAMVLVDFEGKADNERPDFYVLTPLDWENLVREELSTRISVGEVVIDSENVPLWTKQVKMGRPYRGMGIRASQVGSHKEAFEKIEAMARSS